MRLSSTIPLSASALLFAALVCGPASTAQAQNRRFSLPPQASEIAQGIYDLGQARDVDGAIVQGFAFIHYKKDFVRPDKPGGTKPSKASSCYAFMASGAKWKGEPEPFVFDQTVPKPADRLALMETAIATWEATAGKDIIGDGVVAAVSPTEVATTLNGFNEVTFGTFEDPYVIAMTTVWGIWGGPPAGRQLVEWDMVFGDDTWAWWYGDGDEPTTFMDFLSIATHEIGHAMGMDHPNDTCTRKRCMLTPAGPRRRNAT